MSAESIINQLSRRIIQETPNDLSRELLLNFAQHGPRTIVQLHWELGNELGLPERDISLRCQAIAVQNTLIHLADDLADEAIENLPYSLPQGVTALYGLQQLFGCILADADIEANAIFKYLHEVGCAQQLELATENWTFERSLDMARRLNGQQFQAYGLILSHGTEHVSIVNDAAHAFGVLTHIANDIASADPRFVTLNLAEQDRLRDLGFKAAQTLTEKELQSYQRFSTELVEILKR